MKKSYLLCLAALCVIAGCKDDGASTTVTSGCSCPEGQVCSVGGECYANAACAACTADEKCVSGVCYDKTTACGACRPEQVCVNDTCYAVDDPCAKCDGKVCVSGVCYDKDSPCAKCGSGEKCVGEKCYGPNDSCFACDSAQVCNKGTCYDAGHPCATCKDDEVCATDHCETPKDPCDACNPGDSCEGGTCIPCPNAVCNGECCQAGEICDAYSKKCGFNCGTEADPKPACRGMCCDEGLICNAVGFCDRVCEFGKSCGYDKVCCGEDEQCLKGNHCAPQCDAPRVLCGKAGEEVCCADGEVCLEGVCHTDCGAKTRCGTDQNLCCDPDTQLCMFNKCLDKGKTCQNINDCELWEFCDDDSHTCVSQDANDAKCIYRPPIGAFAPKVKWHYKDTVENTPAVVDLTGDGIPEVFFVNMSYDLVALNGTTGELMAKSTAREWNRYDGMAAADVDNDGNVEVIVTTADATKGNNGIATLNLVKDGDGWKWSEKSFLPIDVDKDAILKDSNVNSLRYYLDIHPAVADIDSDGTPDIVTTRGIIKGNDLNHWKCKLWFPSYGTWYQFGFVIADLDQDNNSEIIGHRMYDNNCNLLMEDPTCTFSEPTTSGAPGACWGFAAVADMMPNDNAEDKPGELVPEIVRVNHGNVSVWKVYNNKDADGKTVWTQQKKWEHAHPGGGGGHPNIADFNGDKKADIGIAGSSAYAVFDGRTGEVLWQKHTSDKSSHRTGSSVFDFEGDGKAEVVYRDECYVRVYSGIDGNVIMEEPCTSGTVIDYPLIVDVDADGRTDIITTSSGKTDAAECQDLPNQPLGIVAYEDSYGRWVRTRRIWNQHTYHVTNINEDGSVPQYEQANWLNPRLNTYRANTQPDDMFNAPNLKAGDLRYSQDCEKGIHTLQATVKNEGSLSSRPVWVSFYIRDYPLADGTFADVYLGSTKTESNVTPSGSAVASFAWNGKGKLPDDSEIEIKLPQKVSFTVDRAPDAPTESLHNECNEDDNDSEATEIPKCIEIVA